MIKYVCQFRLCVLIELGAHEWIVCCFCKHSGNPVAEFWAREFLFCGSFEFDIWFDQMALVAIPQKSKRPRGIPSIWSININISFLSLGVGVIHRSYGPTFHSDGHDVHSLKAIDVLVHSTYCNHKMCSIRTFIRPRLLLEYVIRVSPRIPLRDFSRQPVSRTFLGVMYTEMEEEVKHWIPVVEYPWENISSRSDLVLTAIDAVNGYVCAMLMKYWLPITRVWAARNAIWNNSSFYLKYRSSFQSVPF